MQLRIKNSFTRYYRVYAIYLHVFACIFLVTYIGGFFRLKYEIKVKLKYSEIDDKRKHRQKFLTFI